MHKRHHCRRHFDAGRALLAGQSGERELPPPAPALADLLMRAATHNRFWPRVPAAQLMQCGKLPLQGPDQAVGLAKNIDRNRFTKAKIGELYPPEQVLRIFKMLPMRSACFVRLRVRHPGRITDGGQGGGSGRYRQPWRQTHQRCGSVTARAFETLKDAVGKTYRSRTIRRCAIPSDASRSTRTWQRTRGFWPWQRS